MKYIKLFENFFDFDFGDRLWVETDDWWKWDETVRSETPEELTSEEIFRIFKTFKGNDEAKELQTFFQYDNANLLKHIENDPILPWYIDSYVVVPRLPSKDKEKSCINITLISKECIIIYKFHDDRWMVELFDEDDNVRDAKFVCDSYEGLVNWIEDWREKIMKYIVRRSQKILFWG